MLGQEEVTYFKREGYLCPLTALSPDEAAQARAALEDFEHRHGPMMTGGFNNKSYLLIPHFNALMRTPAILDAVESIIGPDIFVWGASFFVKEAHNRSFVTWHQDAAYVGLDPPHTVTAWIALTDSNAGNGAMRVIPRTHDRHLPHVDTFAPDNLLSRGQEVTVAVEEKDAVMLALKAGQFSLHDSRIVHGSDPNDSADRRIGYVVRYIPTYMKQTIAKSDTATLVRGEDRYGHFTHEPRPASFMDPRTVAYRDAIMRAHERIIYAGTAKAG